MDQLTAVGPLLPLQQDRLELARKLMVGVEVAGLLNNPQLCLQLVVRCYGILTPLVQHRVPCRAVVEMLMHCYVVLLEIPGGLLNTKLPGVTFTIHHMVAAMSFYVGKVCMELAYGGREKGERGGAGGEGQRRGGEGRGEREGDTSIFLSSVDASLVEQQASFLPVHRELPCSAVADSLGSCGHLQGSTHRPQG